METITLSDDPVSWPAIAFGGDGSLVCAVTMSTLQWPSAQAWRNGYFNRLVLIDTKGVVHRVNKVTLGKQNAILWAFRRVLNFRLPVELRLEAVEKITLDEAKTRFVIEVRSDRSFWESGGDLADLEQRIAAAASFTALRDILR